MPELPEVETVRRGLHHLNDVQRGFENCRAYNKPDTEYVACASKLEAWVRGRVRTFQSTLGASAPA